MIILKDEGVFKQAVDSRTKQQITKYLEDIELARGEVENIGVVTLEKLKEKIVENEIVTQDSITDISTDEESEPKLQILTKEGYIFIITASTSKYVGNNERIKITYDSNGGTGGPTEQTLEYGETISEEVPTRAGAVFLGWGLDNSSDVVKYEKGATFQGNSDCTLFAVWHIHIASCYKESTSILVWRG